MKPMRDLLNVLQFRSAIIRLFFCFAVVVVAQVQTTDSTAEERVKTISTSYSEVNRDLIRCKQVNRDLRGESTDVGELTAYRSGQSLRKLVAKIYGETGQAFEEYNSGRIA